MREIKFRAFIDGKMVNADRLAFEEYGPLIDQLASVEHLMQFTGFLDSKGKEIYEGDIVKAVADAEYSGDDDCISDVIFNNSGGWEVRTPPNDDCVYDHGLPVAWGGWKSIEIIGNIHESPELLEE